MRSKQISETKNIPVAAGIFLNSVNLCFDDECSQRRAKISTMPDRLRMNVHRYTDNKKTRSDVG